MFNYQQQPNGGVALVNSDNNEVLFEIADGNVTFAVSPMMDRWLLFKHGPRDAIERYVTEYNAKVSNEPELPELRVCESKTYGWSLTDINKCLGICDYIGVLLDEAENAIDTTAVVSQDETRT